MICQQHTKITLSILKQKGLAITMKQPVAFGPKLAKFKKKVYFLMKTGVIFGFQVYIHRYI